MLLPRPAKCFMLPFLLIWCTATGVRVNVRREKEGRKLGKKRASEGEKGNE